MFAPVESSGDPILTNSIKLFFRVVIFHEEGHKQIQDTYHVLLFFEKKRTKMIKRVEMRFPELSTGPTESSQVCDLENRGFC